MNDPGTIGSMQYAGMQRIMIGDGFTADAAARAVAAFAAAVVDVWVWVTEWMERASFRPGAPIAQQGGTRASEILLGRSRRRRLPSLKPSGATRLGGLSARRLGGRAVG